MRKGRRRPLWPAVVLLLFLSSLGGPVQASTRFSLTFTRGTAWAVRTPVTVFFSAQKLSGTTDIRGRVEFEVEGGNAFWIEVSGVRLAKLYRIDSLPLVIDLDKAGTMTWRGGSAR